MLRRVVVRDHDERRLALDLALAVAGAARDDVYRRAPPADQPADDARAVLRLVDYPCDAEQAGERSAAAV